MRRVLVDTNIIVSALIFPGSLPARALWAVIEREHLVLTDWILDELREVVERKWPERLDALEAFLGTAGYELLPVGAPGVEIRDPGDQPILDAAIARRRGGARDRRQGFSRPSDQSSADSHRAPVPRDGRKRHV